MESVSETAASTQQLVTGVLHIFVAFDWGELVDLPHANLLAPSTSLALARRPRTPSSITFKPAPLCFRLPPVTLSVPPLDLRPVAQAELTLFDFAAASVALQVPFTLPVERLLDLAGRLADPSTSWNVVQAARAAVHALHDKLLPAIRDPHWNEDLWEEYFVFQFAPGSGIDPQTVVSTHAAWLSGLLRLESQPLSSDEVEEALRLLLRYSPNDLLIADWAAAVLFDEPLGCEETLQTIEFANLQLLEYRLIDDRLDGSLTHADQLLQKSVHNRRFSFHAPRQALRQLGELKVEANVLFERTGNVFKLVGDQYLARVYRMLAKRFHLPEWERSIQRKLEVIEGIYQVISDQAHSFRAEFLEIIVVLLILIEVIMGCLRH